MQSFHPPNGPPAYTNGSAHGHTVPAHAGAPPRRDPLAHVLSIGADMTWVAVVAVIGALLVHGAAGLRAALIDPILLDWAGRTGMQIENRIAQSIEISTVRENTPPPPVVEPKEEEQPKEVITNKPLENNPYEDLNPTNPPPNSAEASQVLTANDDVVDFTGNTFVTGNATTYSGGKTTREGKKKTEEKVGGPGGGGTAKDPAPAKPSPDLSRAVSLAGGTDWKCPWPAEADAEQMDEAKVEIDVAVGPDGRPSKVAIVTDPGFGFAREAKSCALRQSYNPAHDRDGKPIASSKKFRVRFER